MASVLQPGVDNARQDLYRRMDKDNLAPLWEVLHALVPPQPQSPCRPALWKYRDIRPYIEESGRVITAREAVRRVLVLENPGMRGQSQITRSLYCGLQLILPGEIAPSHRHTQSALRLIVEGAGAYTAVDGERVTMRRGDFIITPSWTWHDHGNVGDGPMVWLDGLDIHMVKLFEASFREGGDSDEAQHTVRPEGDSVARYGANLAPIDDPYDRPTSPVFSYPYRRTREALEIIKRREAWSPWHGLKMKYINPRNGDYAIPTMATFIQLLPKGFVTTAYRSTDSAVYVCVEGWGRTRIGGKAFEWGPRDVFVCPSWMPYVHEAEEESVLFSFSDRSVQEKLGFWRERKDKA